MISSAKVGEISSREVVNGFGNCRDLSDAVPLYTARGIYLKPLAKIHISINLPQLKTPGKTISTWEVMEKVRVLIRPDEFASLKVVKNTLEFIRLEGDLGDKSRLQRVLARLDRQRLNLAGFQNILKVKAAEVKDDFPTRHSWDSYFRDAKHMNELKAGERPDTIHISGFPVKWFSEDNGNTPSEPLVTNIFKKWGNLRRVDVPAADPYRSRMRLGSTIQKFSYEDGIFFDAYIQYVEYMDFVKAMDALRGMKLLKKEKEKNHLVASIKVDFDKTKHMSDSSVSHREFERKRLIAQDNLAIENLRRKEEAEAKKKEEIKKKEELDLKGKDSRRRTREEKRKRKALTVIRKQEEDKVSLKIAREEKKLIKAQRQLESIRLLDALFDRIKIKHEKNEIDLKSKIVNDKKDGNSEANTEATSESKINNLKKKDKKEKSKIKKKNKKEKKKKKKISGNISSHSSENKKKSKDASEKNKNSNSYKDSPSTYSDTFPGLPPQAWYSPIPLPCDPTIPYRNGFPRLPPQAWYYNNLNSGVPLSCNVRGLSRERRGARSVHAIREQSRLNEQYYKYFASLVGQDYHVYLDKDNESDSSASRSRRESDVGRKRSRSKSRSRLKSRKVKRSDSKNRSRSPSKSRSRIKHRTRSRSKSRSHSKSRSRSKDHSRARTPKKRPKSRVRVTRAKSRTNLTKRRSRSKTPTRSRSWSKNADSKVKNKQATTQKTDKHKETNKEITKASPSTTPKEKRKEETIVALAQSVKPG